MEEKSSQNQFSTKKDAELNVFNYINEEGITLFINLNKEKENIILKLTFPEIKKYYYSKELTQEEIANLYPILVIEEDCVSVLIESINNYGIKTQLKENNENIIYLIIKIKINSKIKEISIELDKIDSTKDEIISSMIEKVNNLLNERREIYGLKSFKELKIQAKSNFDQFNKKLEEIEKKLGKIVKTYNKLKETNILACSNIISSSSEVKLLLNTLKQIENENNKIQSINKSQNYNYQNSENLTFKLVYRATRDGDSALEFHKRCDKIGPNIILVKTDKNIRFGGFTNLSWDTVEKDDEGKKDEGDRGLKNDQDSFCFSLTNKKVYLHNFEKEGAILCSRSCGPIFCDNIFAVNNNMLSKGGYCSNKDQSCFSGQLKDYEISGGNKNFNIKELEVFEIDIFKNNLN